jgi:nucleotide-binding universal stress UspA family protein
MMAENSIKTILVGVDASVANRPALAWALDAARTHGSELVAVYAWHVPAAAYSAPGYVPLGSAEMTKVAEQMVEEELSDLGTDGTVAVRAEVVEGQAQLILRDRARDPKVELVVVGTRGHGTAAGMVLGSVSHALSCAQRVGGDAYRLI